MLYEVITHVTRLEPGQEVRLTADATQAAGEARVGHVRNNFV